MPPPNFLSLCDELLIEVISNLGPLDVHACQCVCRRLNKVIVNSLLIQYILRKTLFGVFDPLEPGISLLDRLDALEQWEIAWREMDLDDPIAAAFAHTFDISESEALFEFLGEQHVIAYRTTEFDETACYSFIDLHTWSSSSTDAMQWTTIDFQNLDILLFAFAPELNLSVAFSTSFSSDYRNTTVVINPMSFDTGERHPLASKSKLKVAVSHAAIHNLSEAMVIGDYILYWVGASIFSEIHENNTLCNIYLVAWKEGWISELRASLPGVYASQVSVLSEEIILLVRLREPALELCRLVDIGNSEKVSLETVCILSLPVLTSRAFLRWVSCSEEHPGHALFSKNHHQPLSRHSYPHLTTSGTGSLAWQPKGRVGARSYGLRSVPSDGIVNLVMEIGTLSHHNRIIEFIVRRRTLLEFTNPQARPGAGATGVTRMGMRTVPMIPWETWGPTNSRILDNGPSMFGGISGERRVVVQTPRITMRDFNPYRVRRALALLGGAGREVTLACGSVVKVVKEASVYCGGEYFCSDIETSMPYVETVTSYNGCHDISIDESYLVVEVLTTENERKLYLHSLVM